MISSFMLTFWSCLGVVVAVSLLLISFCVKKLVFQKYDELELLQSIDAELTSIAKSLDSLEIELDLSEVQNCE